MIESSGRLILLRMYETKIVSTFKGKGTLIECGKHESSVRIGDNILKIKNDTILPITTPLYEITADDADELGKILTDNECYSFKKHRHPSNSTVLCFQSKSIDFGYEINTKECSINSAYELKNVLESYIFLMHKGYTVSKHFNNMW